MQNEETYEMMAFPCGKCEPCLKSRISGWSFRLLKEEEQSSSSFFLTLTYQKIPLENGQPTLIKKDVQDYMKRLRKSHEKTHRTLKYYTCGEYGSKFGRPHYHQLLFNADEDKIQKAWTHGYVHFGDVSNSSVGYCLKYMMKMVDKKRPYGIQPEFQITSKGLGISYLTEQMMQWHWADLLNRCYIQHNGGEKFVLPRYYKKKLYTGEELRRIGVLQQSQADVNSIAHQIAFYQHRSVKKTGRLTEVF